jgi:CBS domain-containing protein
VRSLQGEVRGAAEDPPGGPRRHRVGALPIVSDGELLGIVTETDVLRLLERCHLRPHSESPAAATVETCMEQPLQTAAPDDDLLEAGERLHAFGVRHLPVLRGESSLA